MYAVLGVASFGLEIGEKFYESCATFENDILPSNLPALLYVTKVSSRPNSLVKGPDIFDLGAVVDGRSLTVTASQVIVNYSIFLATLIFQQVIGQSRVFYFRLVFIQMRRKLKWSK